MRRLLRWISNVIALAYGGSALLDAGDGDPVLSPADVPGPRWVAVLSVLTPLVVIVLAVLGGPGRYWRLRPP